MYRIHNQRLEYEYILGFRWGKNCLKCNENPLKVFEIEQNWKHSNSGVQMLTEKCFQQVHHKYRDGHVWCKLPYLNMGDPRTILYSYPIVFIFSSIHIFRAAWSAYCICIQLNIFRIYSTASYFSPVLDRRLDTLSMFTHQQWPEQRLRSIWWAGLGQVHSNQEHSKIRASWDEPQVLNRFDQFRLRGY
jgi:hypothetical protein